MSHLLEAYARVVGTDVIHQLRQLAEPLEGMQIVHVNSTRVGGGVAEILMKLVPLMEELGIKTRWEVIQGDNEFYDCTKRFHNGLGELGSVVDLASRDETTSLHARDIVQNTRALIPLNEGLEVRAH